MWEVLSLVTGNPPSSKLPWHQSRDCHLLLEVACFQPLEGGNLPVDCHPSLFQCCCCLPRLVGAQICRRLFFLPTPGRKTEGVAVDCRNFCLSVTSTRSRWRCEGPCPPSFPASDLQPCRLSASKHNGLQILELDLLHANDLRKTGFRYLTLQKYFTTMT